MKLKLMRVVMLYSVMTGGAYFASDAYCQARRQSPDIRHVIQPATEDRDEPAN